MTKWIEKRGGTYELDAHAPYSEEVMAHVGYVRYGKRRYALERKCDMALEFEGTPCNDYRCSNCGKVHNAPRLHRYCPRCGARIRGRQ